MVWEVEFKEDPYDSEAPEWTGAGEFPAVLLPLGFEGKSLLNPSATLFVFGAF